ncbi:ABC transporter permease subunit [Halorubrum sp. CBA1125]|uniref:carbohydrate ABC transporter permease n=1 Tax=Halorubrum sp. CBA1125 TaxID=2668072 RepID=UPI0012E88C29|nr:carbohydrate ABC transporter permease [Halorubrum sp. CBA1125]MUW13805.1 ABC transporter permease subunit [Halorubrum sp. CBA1125]
MSERDHETRDTLSSQYRSDVPVWNRLSYPTQRKIRTTGLYGILSVILVTILFPLYWMFITSVRPQREVQTRNPTVLPTELTLENYESLFLVSDFPLYLQNSVTVVIGVVIVTTTLATLGGYGLTRFNIPYQNTFARGILFGYMFPSILLAIPMYILWSDIGLINSYIGLIFAETALALPFSLWIMWKFFQTVPESLEESARVSGASRFRTMVDIALPIAKPGIVAVGIFSFAISWNEYTLPRILMPDADSYVITTGIQAFQQQNTVMWTEIMGATFLASLPAFLFVYAFQKYLLAGFDPTDIG